MHNQSYAHYQGKKPRNFEANRRGQSAFELVMVTGLMLVVFTTFFIVITNSSISAKKERDTQILREISLLISDEIILQWVKDSYQLAINELPGLLRNRILKKIAKLNENNP